MENTLPTVFKRNVALVMSLVFILWRNDGGKNYAVEYTPQDVYRYQ
jgi:hypothetical protein